MSFFKVLIVKSFIRHLFCEINPIIFLAVFKQIGIKLHYTLFMLFKNNLNSNLKFIQYTNKILNIILNTVCLSKTQWFLPGQSNEINQYCPKYNLQYIYIHVQSVLYFLFTFFCIRNEFQNDQLIDPCNQWVE